MSAELKFASEVEMSNILGVSRDTLRRLRSKDPDNSPPFVRVGGRCLYRLHGERSLDEWLARRTEGGIAA